MLSKVAFMVGSQLSMCRHGCVHAARPACREWVGSWICSLAAPDPNACRQVPLFRYPMYGARLVLIYLRSSMKNARGCGRFLRCGGRAGQRTTAICSRLSPL
jgi:hypothetical protein